MSNDSVKVSLEIATQAAELALKRVEKTTKEVSTSFEVFKGTLIGGLAVDVVNKFASAITGSFASAIKEASNAQTEINNLNTALQNAGIYSEETSLSLQKYADQIEATTTVSGGAVMSNLALLSSMTNLNEEGLKKAQTSALELSAAFGIDLQSATQAVAKAHNGQYGALEKLGVSFVKTKNEAETYQNVLQALEKFSGSAASKTETFDGKMLQMQHAFEKVLESVGNLIIKNPILLSGLESIVSGMLHTASAIDSVTKFIQENVSWLEPLAFGLTAGAVALAAIAAKAFVAAGGLTAVSATASAAWVAITGPVGLVVAGVAAVGAATYALVKNWELVKSVVYDTIGAFVEFSSKAASLIGASGTSAKLDEEAESWRKKANAAREAHEAEKKAQESTTNVVGTEANKRKVIDTEEAQRLADLSAKRQKDIDDYALKLARQTEDLKLQNQLRLEEMAVQFEQESLLESEWDLSRFDAKLKRETDYIQAKQDALNSELEQEMSRIDQSKIADRDKASARLGIQEQYNLNSSRLDQELNKKTLENRKAKDAAEKKLDEQRLTASGSLFGAISDLAAAGGKESFGISKAAAIAEATIMGYLAVQRALASAPPPFNFVAAAAVGIQTGLQVSKIASSQPPSFAQGGIVPGTSFVGDRVTAQVNSGEMVLNRTQQTKLFNLANQGGSNTTNALLVDLIQAVREGASISIDGREIIAVVRDGISSGRVLA